MGRSLTFVILLISACAFAQVKLPPNHRVPQPKPTQSVGAASGKSITAGDLEPYLWEWYGEEALHDVISFVMVSQDAAKRGIVISDAEVERTIDDEIKKVQKSQGGTIQQATAALKAQGFTRSRLFMRTKVTMLIDKIVLADFHPEQFVKVSTILVRAKSQDAAAVGAAISKCQGAYERLKKGEDWVTVLNATTSDDKIISSKGVLGWRMVSVFPDPVKGEIVTLPVGGITRPAQTEFGIQLFRIDAHGATAKLEDLASLKNIYLRDERTKYMSDLKTRSNVQILLK